MIEQRFITGLEVRRDDAGAMISGVALRYGSLADLGGFHERFRPGALRWDPDGVLANIQHDRKRLIGRSGSNLILTHTDRELRAELKPLDTQDGRDALAMAEARLLRGWSIEFEAVKEHLDDHARIRTISEARLRGLGLVDRPAFKDSLASVQKRFDTLGAGIENRASLGRLSGFVPTGIRLGCECSGDEKCHYAEFDRAAFTSLAPVLDKSPSATANMVQSGQVRDVLAVIGTTERPVAAMSAGTLTFRTRPDGGLAWQVSLPDSDAAAGLVDAMKGAPVYGRPYLSQSESQGVQDGDLFKWNKATVRLLILGATDRSEAWTPAALRGRERWDVYVPHMTP